MEISRERWRKWLSTHCATCGSRFNKTDLNGGRCTHDISMGRPCFSMIVGLDDKNLDSEIERAKAVGVGPGIAPKSER